MPRASSAPAAPPAACRRRRCAVCGTTDATGRARRGGRRVRAFGHPPTPPQGHHGYTIVARRLTSDTGQAVVQLRQAGETTEGSAARRWWTNAPVWWSAWSMRCRHPTGSVEARRRRISRPVERLRAICPQLSVSGICPFRGLASFAGEDIGRGLDICVSARSSPPVPTLPRTRPWPGTQPPSGARELTKRALQVALGIPIKRCAELRVMSPSRRCVRPAGA
jgi:hypothetical protein